MNAADVPEVIVHEVAEAHDAKVQQDAERAAATGTEPEAETGEGTGGRGPLGGDSGQSETVAGSGGVGVQRGEERPSGGGAAPERPSVSGGATSSRPDVAKPSEFTLPNPLPAETFGPEDAGIVDKAGNIRLDKYDADTDTKQVIRDMAERNADFIGDRRGTITDDQVVDLASALATLLAVHVPPRGVS